MTSGGNTLSKAERLSGKKSIATLLADGRWGSFGHFRYCYLPFASQEGCRSSSQKNAHQTCTPLAINTLPEMPELQPARIMIAVPKRYFKRAVKRNLLKRRIRETYRVRKIAGADILFQYNSPELADFATISAEVEAILARILEALPEAHRADEHFSAKKACDLPADTTEI
ncbi:MAG: ribonuclease P protein component [Bacteroidales bacterium]|nr:ribonuclease P protein component [Bacteroidales bacterium]